MAKYQKPFFLLVAILAFSTKGQADSKLNELLKVFAEPPPSGLKQTPCLPTPNPHLYDEEASGYAARTRTNDKYGLPGWTRGMGARFHKGVDILPVHFEKLKETVRIEYHDAQTGRDFAKNEPVLVPKDEIYSILDGVVVMANRVEKKSGYGCYVMIEHQFANGKPFISMYAHMDRLEVSEGDVVTRGGRIGWMGRTSSNSGGRTYLKAIPHCHFEIGRVIKQDFANLLASKMLHPHVLGGKYDPRNIQPYQPIEFLREFNAQPRNSLLSNNPHSEIEQ